MDIFKYKNLKKLYLLPISIVSFVIFLFISEEVLGKEAVTVMDQSLISYVYTLRTPWISEVMKIITMFGNIWTVGIVTILTSVILYILKYKRQLALFWISIEGSAFFIWIVKLIFARPRPPVAEALIIESSFSFPSGHSLMAVTFYGLLIFFLTKIIKNKILRLVVIFLGIMLIITIGFSRIYLGVHWPSDVLGGYLSGISWLCLILFFLENRSKQNPIVKTE